MLITYSKCKIIIRIPVKLSLLVDYLDYLEKVLNVSVLECYTRPINHVSLFFEVLSAPKAKFWYSEDVNKNPI